VTNHGRVGVNIEAAFEVVYNKKKLKKSNMAQLIEI